MNLNAIKAKLRQTKWGFLAEMLAETEEPRALMGVNHKGVLLVNPKLAGQIPTAQLGEMVREEFRLAQVLRKTANGFV